LEQARQAHAQREHDLVEKCDTLSQSLQRETKEHQQTKMLHAQKALEMLTAIKGLNAEVAALRDVER